MSTVSPLACKRIAMITTVECGKAAELLLINVMLLAAQSLGGPKLRTSINRSERNDQ